MAYSGKIWSYPAKRLLLFLLLFFAVIGLLIVTDRSYQIWINAADAIVAAGIGICLYLYLLKTKLDINLALTGLICLLLVYSFVRSLVFAAGLEAVAKQMTDMYSQYLQRYSSFKPDAGRITQVQNLFIRYQPAFWSSTQITAAFFGLLLFNRLSILKLPVRQISLPGFLIYPLLAALGLSLYPQTKVWGINLLISLLAAYLIQGTGVLSHFWSGVFARSRMLRTLFFITIIINYPVLALISFIGVLDAWFDFRKIRNMEDINESNTN